MLSYNPEGMNDIVALVDEEAIEPRRGDTFYALIYFNLF